MNDPYKPRPDDREKLGPVTRWQTFRARWLESEVPKVVAVIVVVIVAAVLALALLHSQVEKVFRKRAAEVKIACPVVCEATNAKSVYLDGKCHCVGPEGSWEVLK